MANPQPDQFTKISSELLEAFCRLQLSGSEWSFIHALLRKTYGYNKKEDWITNTQIMGLTGLCKERVSEAKKSLLEKQIVTEKRNKISIQKNYDLWKELRKNVTRVTEKRNYQLRKNVTTIDNIENIQKTLGETSSPESFFPLLDKKKDMWNRQPDDEEERMVDLDGDGKTTAPKKPATKKYPNAPQVRKLFEEVLGLNPANWKMNKTQLEACENLYTERTMEKVRSALEFYVENKETEYCPQIISPYDLDSKWTKLGEFKLKQK